MENSLYLKMLQMQEVSVLHMKLGKSTAPKIHVYLVWNSSTVIKCSLLLMGTFGVQNLEKRGLLITSSRILIVHQVSESLEQQPITQHSNKHLVVQSRNQHAHCGD